MNANALIISILLVLTPTIAVASYDESADGNNVVEMEAQFTQGELAQMLAPIALYPDTLLTHILIAASYPLEIVDAHRWREQNKSLTEKKFARRLAKQDWDESVKALVPFERVLKQMHDDIRWMQDLGDAFLAQEEKVLETIQELRSHARNTGSLEQLDNAKVVYEREKIIIVPRSPEIIYVPYYDTRVVYGSWRWHHYPPVFWHIGHQYHRRHIAWHAGVHIGVGFFFNAIHWHNRHVIVNYHKPRHYRKRHHILSSGYSKRWAHKPHHRRNVAYRAARVHEKYHGVNSRVPYKYKVRKSKGVNHNTRDKQSVKHITRHKTVVKHSQQPKHQQVKNKLQKNKRKELAVKNNHKTQGRKYHSSAKANSKTHADVKKRHISPQKRVNKVNKAERNYSSKAHKANKDYSTRQQRKSSHYKSNEGKSYKLAKRESRSASKATVRSSRSKERHKH